MKTKTSRVDSSNIHRSANVKVGCNPVKIQGFYLEGGSTQTASPIVTITFLSSRFCILWVNSKHESYIIIQSNPRKKTIPDIILSLNSMLMEIELIMENSRNFERIETLCSSNWFSEKCISFRGIKFKDECYPPIILELRKFHAPQPRLSKLLRRITVSESGIM